ncbi:hypothetical protein SAMN05880545_1244 [Microbacterium sp. RU33B]|nr:hypothetical protein SAMN05880545_1244 [Microbacterium sp. RU33B]
MTINAGWTGRAFSCPVDWCAGDWHEHGGNGAAPDEWVHAGGALIELNDGAALSRWSVGSASVTWTLLVQHEGQTVAVADSDSLRDIAIQLRAIADGCEGVADGRAPDWLSL